MHQEYIWFTDGDLNHFQDNFQILYCVGWGVTLSDLMLVNASYPYPDHIQNIYGLCII